MNGMIVGVDGGGTHTTLAVADQEGHILGIVHGGALNYHTIGMEAFRKNLRDALDEVEAKYGQIEAVSMGHSALDQEPDAALAQTLMAGVFPVEKTYIHSDVFMALMGATLGAPGVAVVAGTGSMAVAVDDGGNQHVRGGWGYLLGDAGSGFYLGQQGMIAAADAFDGVGDPTCLLEDFKEAFSVENPRAAIDALYDPSYMPSDMAAFAPRVLKGAEAGDKVCCRIVKEAQRILAGYAAGLMQAIDHKDCPVGVFGGLFEHSEMFRRGFADKLQETFPDAKVDLPALAPNAGAVVYYFMKENKLTAEVTKNLMTTSKP